MVSGCRRDCEAAVMDRGGKIHPRVTLETHYLVIGLLGSTDWLHTTHGRKIEHAIHCQEQGSPLAIVCEEHWNQHLR